MTAQYARIEEADAVFVWSPIYFDTVSAATKTFIERLFPCFTYKDYSCLFPRKVQVGLICTLSADDRVEPAFRPAMELDQAVLSMLLGPAELLVSTNTMHVADYSEIVADALMPGVEGKLEHSRTVFPLDCQKAFDMGARLVGRGL